jgi:molybdopterin converting factor small subunit
MNASEITGRQITEDVEAKKKEIVSELKTKIPEYQTYKRVDDRNYFFEGYFYQKLNKLIEVIEDIPDTDKHYVHEKIFTKDLLSSFYGWYDSLSSESIPLFFQKEKIVGLEGSKNLYDLQKSYLPRIKTDNPSLFLDRDLIESLDIERIYALVIEGTALRELDEAVKKIPNSQANKIESFINQILVDNKTDPYWELRELQNKFNSATFDELIEFFGDLRKVAKGQSESILSDEDFVKLLKAILSNKLLDEAIIPKINNAHRSVLRRLMYDFWVDFSERDIKRLTDPPLKRDYIPFACLFSFFFDKRGNKAFIDDTNESNQRRQLKTILAKTPNSSN